MTACRSAVSASLFVGGSSGLVTNAVMASQSLRISRASVEQDSLTDAKVPMLQRCGAGSVVGFLTGELHPTLAERRNGLAHGDPFGMSGAGSYCAGLFELVRDLIDYAYRDWDLHQTFAPE